MQYITFMTSIYKNNTCYKKTVFTIIIRLKGFILKHYFQSQFFNFYKRLVSHILQKASTFSIQILTSARHKLQLHC